MNKFNFMWGIIGFTVGCVFSTGMGVAFAFIFGLLLFPNKA